MEYFKNNEKNNVSHLLSDRDKIFLINQRLISDDRQISEFITKDAFISQ